MSSPHKSHEIAGGQDWIRQALSEVNKVMSSLHENAGGPDWMRLALSEANLAVRENVYPYPGVGVVLVHQDKLVARARNGRPGEPHAEIRAIESAQKAGFPLNECVLFTNLEPCTNTGLVLPCTKSIIDAGIRETHVAMMDPYHLVRGKGLQALRAAGVNVTFGEYTEEARWQNARYFARFCPHCGWPVAD